MLRLSFNHIALSVKDIDKSVTFYKKVFQLNDIENTASNSSTRWLSLTNVIQLHLIPRPNAEIKTNKAVHFALSTNDINAFIKHIESLGINYSDWKNTSDKNYIRDDGIKQFYFQDPDGYWIEINDDN